MADISRDDVLVPGVADPGCLEFGAGLAVGGIVIVVGDLYA